MLSARSKIGDLCNLAFPLKIVNPLSAKRAKIDGACGPLKKPFSLCKNIDIENPSFLRQEWPKKHYF